MEIKNIGINKPELNKIDNTETANQPQTPENVSDASVDSTIADESIRELDKTSAPINAQRRHSVIYLAGGIWRDSHGIYWCRDKKKNCISSMVLTDEEFSTRDDIKYMIQYGAIKDIISE